ncbi:hypothetical protein HanPI659440_Chr17g0695691 [Helianthus annuus]|nr:hypothetical protein HanPI659440_Chr17g0695691 [Helianthus annuus]
MTYDEANKAIHSIVKVHNEKKEIVVTEALIHEVVNFPDDENSPTRFLERMVKGCMPRMGYVGALNVGNYLKSKCQKPYKFIVHCVLMSLSHTKGRYDAMRDYQMNMVTALVLNKKYNFSHIVFHYMVENILTKIDHQNWRNEEEMKEAAYADELKTLEEFKTTPNDWFVKETRRRGKKVTPKSQEGEGSSSQPKKKQKKVAKTLLIDEPKVEEPVVTAEEDPYADIDQVMLNVDDLVSEQAVNVEAEKEKVLDDFEGDDVNKSTTSSSSSSDEEIDENERLRRIQEATEKEKQLRKMERQEKDDSAYVPSPEHVSES